MKKFWSLVLAASVVCVSAGVAGAANAASAAQADALYAKASTFCESVLKARENYAKWTESAVSANSGLKFGDWVGSQYIDKWRAKTLAFADPVKNAPDMKSVFGREPLWKVFDIRDGELFLLHWTNARLLESSIVFLTREIEADKDRAFSFTFGINGWADVYLNGRKLGNVATGVKVFSGELKKGSNRLVFKITTRGRTFEEEMFFVPYVSPAVEIAAKLAADFPYEANVLFNGRYYFDGKAPFALLELVSAKDNAKGLDDVILGLIERSLFSRGKLDAQYKKLRGVAGSEASAARIRLLCDALVSTRAEALLGYDVKNVRAAMEDIKKSYPAYDKDGKLFAELKGWEAKMPELSKRVYEGAASGNLSGVEADAAQFKAFASKALLANPLLAKYPNWVFIKRDSKASRWGLPQNWQGNSGLACRPWTSNAKRSKEICATYNDELRTFELSKPMESKTLFKPAKKNLICDLDVSFDGGKVLFSTLDDKMFFRMDELDAKSGKVKTITPSMHPDIDYYDGIYLPDGRIMFCSTACWVGVPCVAGTDSVANLYVMDPEAGSEKDVDDSIRQLTFEQDADWMPVLMENGRVMYTRWEYVDNSHYFSRILMHMNPDGTAQSSLYGSTSYWPNSLFYARQIPGDPNKFVGIVSGHHGINRSGELHLFDISKGTKEEAGRVHQFPKFGREYVAETKDELVRGKFPQIVHPFPLSENFIVASMRHPELNDDKFGIYLIDRFDNMVPLQQFKDDLAFEAMPLMERQKPVEIADKTNPDLDYGYVFLNDIYQGEGLKDVPRGTVKALRVLEYHYAYRDMGSHDIIGNEGSWDVKRIHGTVPVEPDGSAMFKVPASRPLALQPLDENGRALALMRTWFTVMPGEVQSCVGCHEGQGMSPTSKPAMASRSKPSEIKPFVAGVRGYSFVRDVQPVLDRYCAGCHDGSNEKLPNFKRGVKGYKNFPKAYLDLAKFVRRSGPECNQNMLIPLEFNSETSELVHILKKGHKGVKLDDESMRILTTWIDLNVPCYGSWKDIRKDIPHNGDVMRRKYLAKYANRHDDPDAITYDGGVRKFEAPAQAKRHANKAPKADGFPFDSAEAAAKVAGVKAKKSGIMGLFGGSESLPKEIVADVDGAKVRFVLVPAGSFVMGSNNGFYDEGPARVVRVEKPFYMSQFEITNAQFAKFDPKHDSGYHDRQWKDHINRGYPANEPNQPVVRINWNQANDYCKWLSGKLGVNVSLPTEKQWEWAARAGTDTDFWFGKLGVNYGAFENLADYTIKNFAVQGVDPQPRVDESPLNAYTPFDEYASDGQLLGCDVGLFKPNAFGLYDMLGNVSEWTADDYTETLGGRKVADRKTVRGGSWRDRAKRSRVTIRRDYYQWQKVYNVGLRLVIDDVAAAAKALEVAEKLPPYVERDVNPKHDNVPLGK